MRTAAMTLVCAAALACAAPATASPAGGVRDFELALAGAGGSAAAAGQATRLLRPRTARQFDLVGFRWASGQPAISIRSRGEGGWSPWTPVGVEPDHGPDGAERARGRSAAKVSDPVWTGPATRIEVRVTGRVSGLRAHFVAVSSGVKRSVARTAGTGGTTPTLASPGATAPSSADGATPGNTADVAAPPAWVTREQWGASRCKPRALSGYGEVIGATVHHTVSTNTYSQQEAPSVVLAICRYHRYSNGWLDVGYNALVDRFGTIYEGRGGGMARAVAGAHAQGYNGQATGVALVGSHMTTPPSAEALAGLRAWLGWKLPLHGVTRNERVSYMSTGGRANRFAYGRIVFRNAISGHRDFDSTTCPGNELYDALPALAAGLLSASDRAATRLTMRMSRGAPGSRSIVVAGRLRGGGTPLAGKSVAIQAYTAAGWSTQTRVESDANGVVRGSVTLKRRASLRAMFEGDDHYRPGRSVWKYPPKLP